MTLKAELVEKVSKKGSKYICVELYLTDKTKKLIFLTEPEKALINMYYSNK